MTGAPRLGGTGLIYYPDDRPGISRRRCGKGFSYRTADGQRIDDPAERARIAAIAVPPAYREVWITPCPNGHLQATGRDARGRKQYRYHPDWAAHRAEVKFDQLAAFGRALPRLRGFIRRSLGARAGSPELAIGTVLALIDRASIRVGNPAYLRDNGSYGATTLLDRHVRFGADGVALTFRGKGGSLVRRRLTGRALQRALSRVHDLPGAVLASWTGADGMPHAVRSEQVNDAIAELCGQGHSAKTFRTWNGTLAAYLRAARPGPLTVGDLAASASDRLDNSPAVARSSYVHPAVIGLARLDPDARLGRIASCPGPRLVGLRAGEPGLIGLLEARAVPAAAAEPQARHRGFTPKTSKGART